MRKEIRRIAENLIATYNTNSPKELCERLGIGTIKADLPKATRGFCLMLSEGTAIVLNSELDEREETAVLAHELGHAVLHEGCNYMFMTTNTCLLPGKYEKEADLFAAHLLIDKAKDLELETFSQLSQSLNLPLWSVEQVLNDRGF